ncbi:DUF5333 domain-containing protein [Cognatishimia sp. SS12]|uniref:DUF5333 domain-containing protein n=1 Tax=Cognatishimia sp. SS12 TaxID=2979465 RepID=UPI00232BC2D0|nr:DUF5333 domain-containing protein [Cognatishimia sp. SS12]MDC0736996.1 DUF5333 domain-containing protein [Cognatishimia sp. SS12]
MRMMALALVLAASTAQAKPPLEEVKSVTDGLLWVGIADEIRNVCPSISARMVKALGYINSIQADAKARGYTKAEIDAFRTSEANKAELRRRGEAYLKSHGVDFDDPESYCVLGRAEIKKSSQIGALLKAK